MIVVSLDLDEETFHLSDEHRRIALCGKDTKRTAESREDWGTDDRSWCGECYEKALDLGVRGLGVSQD